MVLSTRNNFLHHYGMFRFISTAAYLFHIFFKDFSWPVNSPFVRTIPTAHMELPGQFVCPESWYGQSERWYMYICSKWSFFIIKCRIPLWHRPERQRRQTNHKFMTFKDLSHNLSILQSLIFAIPKINTKIPDLRTCRNLGVTLI